jgi:ribonuclease HII
MFGRVYAAAFILPNESENNGFNFALMKDSKKFSSTKKIKEAYEHIKTFAKAYCVQYAENEVIDDINIRNGTFRAMHDAIKGLSIKPEHLLVDGNDFKPYVYINDNDEYTSIPNTCIEGGDNTYCAIAAASILAKVERDKYIEDMCDKYPKLDEYYGLRSNKGYGCKRHMDGIKTHGISKWHRRSFGICKTFDEFNDADTISDVVEATHDAVEATHDAVEDTNDAIKPPSVVRISRKSGKIVQNCDIYIGNKCKRAGWDLPNSKWASPFTIKNSGSIEEAMNKYRDYVKNNKELMDSISELSGKTLGCWCKPKLCHGDVLVELFNEKIES